MTLARKYLISPETAPYYHAILNRIGIDSITWIDELNQFKFNDRKALGTIEKIKKYIEHIKAKIKMDISLKPALE